MCIALDPKLFSKFERWKVEVPKVSPDFQKKGGTHGFIPL
jgi:hypothetical protein